jgi:hypothetical protein
MAKDWKLAEDGGDAAGSGHLKVFLTLPALYAAIP